MIAPRFSLCLLALLIPSLASAEDITPAGKRLERVIEKLDVEHHWLPGVRVHWKTGTPTQPRRRAATHCSAFAAAAADRLGVYLLRPPEHGQTLLANAQQRWLLREGCEEGWTRVKSWQEAQRRANQGELVVASYRNPNAHKPGHMAVVMPSTKSKDTIAEEGPDVAWAGRHNHTRGSLFEGFRKHPKDEILFFAHKVEK